MGNIHGAGMAINRIGEFDLVIAGDRPWTAIQPQIGPQVAEFMGIPQLTYVRKLEAAEGKVVVERVIEAGCERIEAPTPVLVTVLASLNEPRHPTVQGLLFATSDRAPIKIWNAADIWCQSTRTWGFAGSLTQVIRTFTPKRLGTQDTWRGPRLQWPQSW